MRGRAAPVQQRKEGGNQTEEEGTRWQAHSKGGKENDFFPEERHDVAEHSGL